MIFLILVPLAIIPLVTMPLVAMADEDRPQIVVPRKSMEQVYVKCAGCHRMDGSGGGGYGGVAASFRETQLSHDEMVMVITDGRPHKGMPSWKGMLDPREIEGIATYIEENFKGKTTAANMQK